MTGIARYLGKLLVDSLETRRYVPLSQAVNAKQSLLRFSVFFTFGWSNKSFFYVYLWEQLEACAGAFRRWTRENFKYFSPTKLIRSHATLQQFHMDTPVSGHMHSASFSRATYPKLRR